MSRASHRVWSKGSSRGVGPSVRTGTVRVREHVELEATPMDVYGRKLERCGHCGAMAPRHPLFCACFAKCSTCKEWHSTAMGSAPHVCGERAA